MNNFLKTFFIFVSLLISLIFGGQFNNQAYTNFAAKPINIETHIVKNSQINENSVVQSNNPIKYFVNLNKRNNVFTNSYFGFSNIKNLKINYENCLYKIKYFAPNEKYFSLFLKNEICTRAP